MNQTAVQGAPATRNRGADLFEQANTEYDAGRYEKALWLFEEAIAEGVASEVVYNNMGATLDALGRNEEAVRCYKKATSLSASYELAWHNLGNSLFIQERYSDSSRAYSRAAGLNPSRLENWSGLAAAYAKLDKPGRTVEAVKELSRFADDDPSVLLLQADLYMDCGRHEDALTSCKNFVARVPAVAQGYSHLGNVLHEKEDYAGAVAAFEQALKYAPGDKEVWNNLGYTYFCAGALDKALECFEKSLQLDPGYKHAWYNKGYAYHGADMLEQAVGCYRKAIDLDPGDRVLWNNYGNALYNLGKYAESIPKFVEALRVDADYEIAWNNIGNALEKMGAYGEAIPYHDRSLEISPDFDYALYAKGVCKARTGDPESGYDLVIESLDLNPSYDEAWKARSQIAGQLGRWDEALLSIEESLATNPEFDEGWSQRGEILLAVGDPEAAHASFEMALLCLSNVRTDTVVGLAALLRRGEVLARLGRFDEALANMETVLLTERMTPQSLTKVLELRRFLNILDLPVPVKRAAENCKDCKAMLRYVEFLLDAGDMATATEAIKLAPAIDGEENERKAVEARLMAMKGDVDGALALLSSAEPEPDSLRLAGELKEASGDMRGASQAYARAMELRPSDGQCALSLARVRARLGDHRGALRSADVAIGIDLLDWEPHKVKADAFRALGFPDKADEELARAKDLLASSGLGHEERIDVVKA